MEINSLKVNQEISDIKEKLSGLIDLFYPVGSLYETFNAEFDPNESWGGYWKKDTIGYVTVGAQAPNEPTKEDDPNTWLNIGVGNVKGEVNHTLTVNEMPKHTHHANSLIYWLSGMQNEIQSGSSNWYIHEEDLPTTGGDKPHNNIQPSIGVYRWHRIS